MSTILICEGDLEIVKIIKDILEKKSHTVLHAGCGEEVFDILNRNQVDLCLISVWAGDMYAQELIMRLHKKELKPPIIIMANYINNSIRHALEEMGVIDYVTKPVTEEELIKAVQKNI